jgi:hypothetical protein
MADKPHHFKETLIAIWNWAWGFFELQSVGDDVKDHAPLIRKRVSVLILLFLVGLFGFTIRDFYDDSLIRSSDENARENGNLANIYKSQLDAANNSIVNLKVDDGETKREKDSEIEKLTTENASLNNQLTSIQSAHVMEFSTNFDASISNILVSSEYPQSDIVLSVNGDTNLVFSEKNSGIPFQIKNIILLTTNRDIRLRLFNKSRITAIHSFVTFIGIIDPTNFYSDGWVVQPIISNQMNNWRYDTDKSLPGFSFWDIATIRISTNLQYSIPAEIDVGADNSETKSYFIGFGIPK